MSKKNTIVACLMVLLVAGPAWPAEAGEVGTTPLWDHALAGRVAAVPAEDGDQLLVGAGDRLYGLSRRGDIIWQWPLRGVTLSRPAVAGGTLFVHTNAGLTAYDRTGKERWHVASPDRGPLVAGNSYWGWGDGKFEDPWALYRSAPMVLGDTVFFADTAGVHAVRASDGSGLWSQDIGTVTADIAVYQGNLIVGSWDNRLYSLDAAAGNRNWVFEAALPMGNSPEWSGWQGFHVNPVVDGDTVYAGTRGTYFYAVNAQDGSVRYAIKHGTSWIGSPALVTEASFLFALSDGKGVQGHAKTSSNQLFFEPAPGPVFAAPVTVNGAYIVGTLTGEILAFDPARGSRRVLALHQEEGHYYGYFATDRFGDAVSAHSRAVQGMEAFLNARHGVLSLAVIDDTLVVGTGSGRLMAFALKDVLPQ